MENQARTMLDARYLVDNYGDVITPAMREAAASMTHKGQKASVTVKMEFEIDKKENTLMAVKVSKATSKFESTKVPFFQAEESKVMYLQQTEMSLQSEAPSGDMAQMDEEPQEDFEELAEAAGE